MASPPAADLDAAVIDRVDEMVEFPLPKLAEREALAKLHFNLLLRPKTWSGSQGSAAPSLWLTALTARAHFIPGSLRISVSRFLKRRCDRTLGPVQRSTSLKTSGRA